MGLIDFFKTPDINEGLERYKATDNAILLDVRTEEEYNERNIPGSINISLQKIDSVTAAVKGKDTPLFVYCRSGNRSGKAVKRLKQLGYTQAENIGGIKDYK